MTAKSYRSSIVATKYGSRPIIDVPSISVADNRHRSAPAQYKQYPLGNIVGNMATYNQQAPHMSSPTHLPMVQPQQQAQPQHPFWSNILQNSNVVPFNYQHPPYQMSNYQGHPPVNYPQQPNYHGHPQGNYPQQPNYPAPPPPQQGYGNGFTDPNGDVHHFYNPNGQPSPFPNFNIGTYGQNQFNNRGPSNFRLEGKLEFGKLVSVQVKDSTISHRDLPEFVKKDLKRMYGHIEETQVKIIAEDGEYNIYATPNLNTSYVRQPGYVYEERKGRDEFDDPYTKKYDNRVPVHNEPRKPVPKPVRD